MIRVYDALKNGYLLNKTVDLSSKTMTLDAAKDLLRHTGTVSGQTISFSNDVWAMILDNEEAVDLLEAAYAKGWGSNEPDITIIANSGYDGVVRVNAADKQLTETSSSSGVWIGSAGTVTSMDCFLKHDSRENYNSTSTNVKKVRFGKNINTSSCTTFRRAFACSNSDISNFANIDVKHLNTSSATAMPSVFENMNQGSAPVIKGIENWNVSNSTNFGYFLSNSKVVNDTFDLHTWHIKSGSDLTSMFGGLQLQATNGNNYKVYYTPGYWAKDPMNDSNLAADRVKPVVYPYHDITVAASSGFNGICRVNNSDVNMTQDSTLGIWYYDVPSGTTVTSLDNMFNINNNSTANTIVSASIKDGINVSDSLQMWAAFYNCYNMRSADLKALSNKVGRFNQIFDMYSVTSALSTVYMFDVDQDVTYYTNYTFRNCANLRYLGLPKFNSATIRSMFENNTNLIRISNLPGLIYEAGVTNTLSTFNGCSALTTIDASGPINYSLSFSGSPLNLASAKVILSALQTVTAETLTFSSTTKGYINADSEALALVTAARNKGWTIAL